MALSWFGRRHRLPLAHDLFCASGPLLKDFKKVCLFIYLFTLFSFPLPCPLFLCLRASDPVPDHDDSRPTHEHRTLHLDNSKITTQPFVCANRGTSDTALTTLLLLSPANSNVFGTVESERQPEHSEPDTVPIDTQEHHLRTIASQLNRLPTGRRCRSTLCCSTSLPMATRATTTSSRQWSKASGTRPSCVSAGDVRGLANKLDYLQGMGIKGISTAGYCVREYAVADRLVVPS